MVNQDRNIPKKKCMGSHWDSNPRPPTLAVDTLTTELRLPGSNPVHPPSIFELKEQAILNNDEWLGMNGLDPLKPLPIALSYSNNAFLKQ